MSPKRGSLEIADVNVFTGQITFLSSKPVSVKTLKGCIGHERILVLPILDTCVSVAKCCWDAGLAINRS